MGGITIVMDKNKFKFSVHLKALEFFNSFYDIFLEAELSWAANQSLNNDSFIPDPGIEFFYEFNLQSSCYVLAAIY